MEKKTKHKKQQAAKHPISESERIKSIVQAMTNPEKSNSEPPFEFSTKTRHILPIDAAAETSVIRLVKKDLLLWQRDATDFKNCVL